MNQQIEFGNVVIAHSDEVIVGYFHPRTDRSIKVTAPKTSLESLSFPGILDAEGGKGKFDFITILLTTSMWGWWLICCVQTMGMRCCWRCCFQTHWLCGFSNYRIHNWVSNCECWRHAGEHLWFGVEWRRHSYHLITFKYVVLLNVECCSFRYIITILNTIIYWW